MNPTNAQRYILRQRDGSHPELKPRVPRNKPHLTRFHVGRFAGWKCYYMGETGAGTNPADAYATWLKAVQ